MIIKVRLLVVLIFLIFILGCSQTTEEKLAKCLNEKGAVMYGTEWCHYCNAQKELFGNEFQYINYVNCETEREKCEARSISGYPTWEIDGKIYPGKRTLENLENLSNCY